MAVVERCVACVSPVDGLRGHRTQSPHVLVGSIRSGGCAVRDRCTATAAARLAPSICPRRHRATSALGGVRCRRCPGRNRRWRAAAATAHCRGADGSENGRTEAAGGRRQGPASRATCRGASAQLATQPSWPHHPMMVDGCAAVRADVEARLVRRRPAGAPSMTASSGRHAALRTPACAWR